MTKLIKENVDITRYTTFGIKTLTRYFAEYESVRELEEIMRSEEYQRSEVFHMGGGSNLLFIKDFDGILLHSKIKGINVYKKDETISYVIVGAGEKWTDLVDYCVENNLAGLENLAYIPGEVGASAIQNVGAYGVEAGDYIHSVECYDRLAHKVVTFKKEECRFGYRDSVFKHELRGRYFVLRVSYRLRNSSEAEHLNYGPLKTLKERLGRTPSIKDVRNEVITIRQSKLPEPEELGSAGSFFTNPIIMKKFYEEALLPKYPDMPSYEFKDTPDYVKVPAGWLVEHAGMKGATEGGAMVYPKQCLVIVNYNNATAKDVKNLAEKVREKVHEKFGVILHPEVNYIDSTVYVTVLGSGTSKGVPEVGCNCEVCHSSNALDQRLRASVLVKTRGVNLLIDVSPDFRQQALKNNIKEIDAVLITHSHYDHVGGIDDLRPFCIYGDMPLYMRPDVADDLRRRVDYCFRPHPYPGVPQFLVEEIGNEPFIVDGVKVIPISVNHAKLPIVGFRIGDFAYITDAKTISDKELEKLEGVKVLIVNALRYKPHFSHFNVEEALKLIELLKPEKAYLTHICHEMGLHEDVNAKLPDNVKLAYDGLKLEVN